MSFSSLLFLFGFLPISCLIYGFFPDSKRKSCLLLLNLLYCFLSEPKSLWILVGCTLWTYCFGRWIDRCRAAKPMSARFLFRLSVCGLLFCLLFFKYANQTADIGRNTVFKISDFRLPIGISCYSFQLISYLTDLYKGKYASEKNPLNLITYASFFPKMIAGPIVRYSEMKPQLDYNTADLHQRANGILRFCCGLGKKVLLGDALALEWTYYRDSVAVTPTPFGAWCTLLFFLLHLYFDFSGYTDMAIGLGKLFGFDLPENFNYPLVSQSITEFWKRWHITLTAWFRDYVYIPLGGNRQGKAKQCRNLLIVWFLTGLWHGFRWNFLLWGGYFALFSIMEHLFLRRWAERLPSALQHIFTLFVVGIGFLFFSETDLSQLWETLRSLVGISCNRFVYPKQIYRFLHGFPLLFLACLGCTPIPKNSFSRLIQRHPKTAIFLPVLSVLLLLTSTAYLADSGFLPFAYRNF